MHGAPWVMGAAGGEFAGTQSLVILQLLNKAEFIHEQTVEKCGNSWEATDLYW